MLWSSNKTKSKLHQHVLYLNESDSIFLLPHIILSACAWLTATHYTPMRKICSYSGEWQKNMKNNKIENYSVDIINQKWNQLCK